MKNFLRKNYNPCGDLTGREREICDDAAENFHNLPFFEVMRAISIKNLAELEHTENFPNVDALINWKNFNQCDDERRASLDFDTFTPLQAGLAKYLVHVLFENRYNIHFNALIDYCRANDVAIDENKINSLAQAANCSTIVNTLIAELHR